MNMRCIYFLCIWIALCAADDVGNANEYIDEVLNNLRQDPSIISKLDPLTIPDVSEKDFQISEGQVRGLSSLYRHGDCSLGYNNEVVNVMAEIAVKDVTIDIKYRVKALFFWIKGYATVAVEHLAVRMEVSGKDGKAGLDSFKVVHLGDYKVKKITGVSVVLNWLLKIIANSIAKKSRGKIIDAMENGVAKAIGGLLDKYTLPQFE